MRVLLLRRQPFGGIARFTESLVKALDRHGIGAVAHDVTDWIPSSTHPSENKGPMKELRRMGQGFDLVHAFGYRTAWACAEAFGTKEAWIYTAFDLPKTGHPELVERLNRGAAGLCVCRRILHELDRLNISDLEVCVPGVEPPAVVYDKSLAREAFDIPTDAKVIFAMGRWIDEKRLTKLLDSMDDVWAANPETNLLIAGEGPDDKRLRRNQEYVLYPEQVRILGRVTRPEQYLAASDLLVNLSSRSGFSMAAVEAMYAGTPVALADAGGLPEMIEDEKTGFLLREDSGFSSQLASILSLPFTLEAVAAVAKSHAAEQFALDRAAESIARVYRDVVS
ncbi:MAG TPA: glycosyltransferase family 4 protein [Fimbriimonadaceae bacterium]|nr:glycosyltransferase family 4 protein [Fimbriimonadaceae bacterium]